MNLVPKSLLFLWIRLIALGVFLVGFFPVKSPVPGEARLEDLPHWSGGNLKSNISESWTSRKVGQVVLVLIDALRADFVLSREQLKNIRIEYGQAKVDPKIDYLANLIKQNEAICSIAQTMPPTVTLPRIKALTTGSIPGFVDVVTNFGSSKLMEDSLLQQWVRSNFSMTMFGDDTWIKLFPDYFLRQDGTTSFFVADYTEVDNNVTRHLAEELSRTDWDLTILHYLGLDHIGHLAGPTSALIEPKLRELSSIIKNIQENLESRAWKDDLPPLILILGDHGMGDSGSHGGASIPEIMTPIVAIGPYIRKLTRISSHNPALLRVNQQDIVPTLAYLTGVPIPRNNFGMLIPQLMAKKNEEEATYAWLYNAQQVARVLERNTPNFQENYGYLQYLNATEILESDKNLDFVYISRMLQSSLVGMSECLRDNLLEYSYFWILLGMLSIFFICSVSISTHYHSILRGQKFDNILYLFEILKILSLGSSSYIEEQHQTFYFLTQTTFILMIYFECQNSSKTEKTTNSYLLILLSLLTLRLARTLNQTGDKWSHLPDVSDWLLKEENKAALSLLHAVTLVILLFMMIKRHNKAVQWSLGLIPAYLAIYLHNSAKNSVINMPLMLHSKGTVEAQIVFGASIIYVFARLPQTVCFQKGCEILLEAFVPIMTLLSTPQSSVLVPITLIMSQFIMMHFEYSKKNTPAVFLTFLNLGFTVHFLQGNSNSLASIDVGAGYTGITFYHPVLVSLLIVTNTYGGLLLVVLFYFTKFSNVTEVLSLLNVFRSLEILFFLVIVFALRYHLFVWTVFSPKLLYETSLSLTYTALFTSLTCLKLYFR